jgi:translation initiation factor 4B
LTGDSKASPFGAARPVDTAAKEKAVEEKRQLAIRQKKEADEKAKTDKAEEKRLAKEKAESEKAKEPTKEAAKESNNTVEKEVTESNSGEEETTTSAPKFDILRRAESSTNDMVPEEEDEGEEQALPVDDKAVKPKEIVRDTRANGSWRGGKSSPAPQGSTTATLEEDGWSTVSKPNKQRNNRRNNAPRAIAS